MEPSPEDTVAKAVVDSSSKWKEDSDRLNNTEYKGKDSPIENPCRDESDSETSDFDDSASNSSYEDYNNESLSSTIVREILEGTYTCLVCTGEVDESSKVWSCENCFRVYDLDCIRDWAIRGSSTDKTNKNWRCPACNFASNRIPKKFTCWCGNVTNPTTDSLIPFSCDNPCDYKYEDCIHSCTSTCHPGNHPICGAMGPSLKCKCGKEKKQLPCLITPYENGWKCEQPCGISLCELGHKCQQGCHSGFCGPCEEIIKVKCYCGKDDIEIKCRENNPKKCLYDGTEWIGGAKCLNKTDVFFDCNIHFEELSCQPLPSEVKTCKMSPSKVITCYCGKTAVSASDRQLCTDPMPECNMICGKRLSCGCNCTLKCHSGECECFNILEVRCSCENYTFSVTCKFIQQGFKPKCRHKCSALLSCRKHYHKEVCCPEEQTALRRERLKKKAIRNNVRTNFEDELMMIEPAHICTETCNRLKSCGMHYCEALCHSGSCGVCLESTNEDLICHCRKTVVPAPVRCGTKLICHEQCVREKECGHRQEVHECHNDSVNCPKCTKIVSKECNCGLNPSIPNVLCSQTNVSCGNTCTIKKVCGHPCLNVCSSNCTKNNIHANVSLCQSLCKKQRKNCPHHCKLKCHLSKPGKSSKCEATVCSELIWITCECGTIRKKIPCGSSLDEESKIGTLLDCSEICIREKRDAELKNALMLSSEVSINVPYPDIVLEIYEKQTTWCSRIEKIIRTFIEEYFEADNDKKVKYYHFPPMSKPQRTFVHELASAFKLYSESQDKEPNRSVSIAMTNSTILVAQNISKAILLKQQELMEKEKVAKQKEEELRNSHFNALIIQDVFFGIIKEELERELEDVIKKFKIENPVMQWMKDSTFVFYSATKFQNMSPEEENKLYLLSKPFKKVLQMKSLAFDCNLCLLDADANYILKIGDSKSFSGKFESESSEFQKNTVNHLMEDIELVSESKTEEEGKKELVDEQEQSSNTDI